MPRAVDVAVIGAGVFGLSTALRLARAGLTVRILDQSANGPPNASAVAAGMLAPVSETLVEAGDAELLRRLMVARDLWPAFAGPVPGLSIDRGSTHLLSGDAAAFERTIAQLSGWGIDFSPLPPPRLGVEIGDDWRLDAPGALKALRDALGDFGVAVEPGEVAAFDGRLHLCGEPLCAEQVVIAAGYSATALAVAAPELASLTPVKGQLVVFEGARSGPTVREGSLYVVPQASGARAGATMEPGRADAAIDPMAIERMRAAAVALSPPLAAPAWRGEAGVRAATPDGWPLVGPSATPGVLLATGARRNGWLLAPLVSRMIADVVTGAEPHPLAQAFHPGRFTR